MSAPDQKVNTQADDRTKNYFRPNLLTWLPIPILPVIMVVMWLADLHGGPHESVGLLMALNFVFSVVVALVVAIVISRSFLANAMAGFLVLGCGVAIWGVAGFVAAGFGRGDANITVTIHNLCVWFSALCQMAGAILLHNPRQHFHGGAPWLAVGYVGALATVGLLVWLVFADRMPTFFVQGQGGTMARQLVLVSTIAMFGLTAALLRLVFRESASPFVHWYSLGLLLSAIGLFGVMIEPVHGDLLSWTGRAAQFLGGAYMLIGALSTGRTFRIREIPQSPGLDKAPYRYGVAIAAVFLAASIRLAFLHDLETHFIFVTFYPIVMLSALYGGLGPGLLAALLSALFADYLLLRPMSPGVWHLADWLGTAVFLAGGAMISAVTEAMHRARGRAAKAEAQVQIDAERQQTAKALRKAYAESEEKVVERTAELRESNAALQAEITERKQAEDAMQAASAYNRSLIEVSLDPLVTIGPDGRITDVNAATEAATGCSRAELIGTKFSSYFTNPEKAEAGYRQVFREGTVRDYPLELQHRDGRVMSVLYSASVYRDVNGRVVGVFAAARDITARKQAEAQREHYFKFFTTSDDLMCIADPNGAFLKTNPACTRTLGYSEAELVSKPFIEFVHPDDRQSTLDEMEKQQRIGSSMNFENRYRCKDGSVRWLSWRATYNEKEGLTYATARDITEIKHAQEALRRQAEELRAHVEELERWRRNTVGRELRMTALKQEVNALLAKTGQPSRYPNAEKETVQSSPAVRKEGQP